MTLKDYLVQLVTHLSPSFIFICFVFILLSWIRILVDYMSGRDL